MGATIFASPSSFLHHIFLYRPCNIASKLFLFMALILGPTIIVLLPSLELFYPYFLSTDSATRLFALPLSFWWTDGFCYRFQLLPPYFFIHRPCNIYGIAEPFWELKSNFHSIEKGYPIPKVVYIATIEQNCVFYRTLTELGVVCHMQFCEISDYT